MNAILKRLTDVALAILGLVLCAPIILVIVVLLRLEEPGNPIFSQERVGKGGKRFRIYKFRKFPITWGTKGPCVTVSGDARMTPLGAILERTKLDELPQFWNILRGEMSFVGPRPESLRFAELFHGEFAEVLEYVPGIFGPNQIEFRNESAMYPPDEDPEVYYRSELFPRKAKNDIRYFRESNWFSDLLWIFRGVLVCPLGVIGWRSFMGLHVKVLFIDYLLIVLAWALSYLIRFPDLFFNGIISNNYYVSLMMVPSIIIVGMFTGGCYRNPVHYFSFVDAKRMALVLTVSWSLAFILLIGLVDRGTSLLLWPLGGLFIVCSLALPRILARMNWEKVHWSNVQGEHNARLLIYGAGKAGGALAKWVEYSTKRIQIKGFIDDDPDLRSKLVFGYSVYGRESDIATVVAVHDITEIWISFVPDEKKLARLKLICAQCAIDFVIIPEMEPFARYALDNSAPKSCNLVMG